MAELCIFGGCVDLGWIGDAMVIPLLPLAILGGCTTTREYTSISVADTIGNMDQNGTCEDNYAVEANARDYLKQICEPASYRILSKNANAFKCIDGEFKTKITFECYLP